MKTADFDLLMMRQALALAQQGAYTARPNPMVGCVIAKDGQILQTGLHWQTGTKHAELDALSKPGKYIGATCYVTLEPCVHFGRTPPCVDAIKAAGIERVVIATLDSNPLIQGKGVRALEEMDIAVEVGLLGAESRLLNMGFFSRMRRHRPYVRAKVGMSLDGKIAMKSGESQWITQEKSRFYGHQLRAQSGAVVTTHATVAKDNCRLTCRGVLPEFPDSIVYKQPLRVIVDSKLQVCPQSQIFKETGETVVAASRLISSQQQDAWLKKAPNANLVQLDEKENHIDLLQLMYWLGEKEINDILVEAGPTFLGALMTQNLIDELIVMIAPKILGDEAISMARLPQIKNLADHIKAPFSKVEQIGDDLVLTIPMSAFKESL